jgi:hypothetical protein
VLSDLRRTLAAFMMKQWHERPTEAQLDTIIALLAERCAFSLTPPTVAAGHADSDDEEGEADAAKDAGASAQATPRPRNPPKLPIRGLLWRSANNEWPCRWCCGRVVVVVVLVACRGWLDGEWVGCAYQSMEWACLFGVLTLGCVDIDWTTLGCKLAGSHFRKLCHSRHNMALWVDKYRPTSLDRLTYHQPLSENLKNLVRGFEM